MFSKKNNKIMKVLMGIFVSLIIISMVLLYTPILLPQDTNQVPVQEISDNNTIEINSQTETEVEPVSMELESESTTAE